MLMRCKTIIDSLTFQSMILLRTLRKCLKKSRRSLRFMSCHDTYKAMNGDWFHEAQNDTGAKRSEDK